MNQTIITAIALVASLSSTAVMASDFQNYNQQTRSAVIDAGQKPSAENGKKLAYEIQKAIDFADNAVESRKKEKEKYGY